jgi:crotonobetainyl-CoA:carnitine CoA-transferase CaiB-like acyl-CoA transferase
MRGIPPIDGDCSARFRALNRGKEVAEVDIKSPAGRGAVRDLVATADVFLHNWAPGRAQRLRLDAEHLAAVNQRLIYAWASGWGDALGPEPPLGTDFMVQAHSGLGAMVRPAGEPPAPSLMTLTDVLGGLICAQGVLGALLARFGSGQGQRVDSSLLSAAMLLRGTEALPAGAPAGAAGAVTASVLPCTDLSAMAADRRFAAALCRDGAVYPRSPWRFSA